MRLLSGIFLCVLFHIFGSFINDANAQNTQLTSSYTVESISMPEGLSAEVGAIEFLPDGTLVACFLRGEVMLYNPKTKKWKLFAEGLQEPLGILPRSRSEFIVMQRPELTRIKDLDGDGQADLYETVTDEFGISGNYHEFNYGPVKDKNGNLFIGLNSASSGGGILKEVRGTLDSTTMKQKGQMFSPVPYRGWIMKLTPQGKLIPYASGFRSPNGLGFDLKGNLFATDNQGDWVGTSPLFHIQEGNFYGHPSALVWKKSWKGENPLTLPVERLDSMRTKASVLFPHGIMANSPTQPVSDATMGKFGPFAGQLFIGEMNSPRIVRVMLEEISGVIQGACIPFIDGNGLRKGNNRLAFAPDGSLWVGQAEHGWAGSKGIQRIVFNGKSPAEVYSMNLTKTGFKLKFTQALEITSASDPANYKFRHYYYNYHKKYGSDQVDVQSVPVTAVKLSPDRKEITVTLNGLKPGYVYEMSLGDIKTSQGKPLANKLVCYTVNVLAE